MGSLREDLASAPQAHGTKDGPPTAELSGVAPCTVRTPTPANGTSFGVAAAIVSSYGFRHPCANPERLTLAREIASFANEQGVLLVILPAGFLCATTSAEVHDLADELARVFSKCAVIAGVDRETKAPQPSDFHVIAADRGRLCGVWPQRVIHGSEPVRLPLEPRCVVVNGIRVSVLACGEVYHRAFHTAAGCSFPDLVVDVGHKSMGRGFSHTLCALARTTEATVLHAQHVSVSNRHPRKWKATKSGAIWTQHRDWLSSSHSQLWAEVKLWDLVKG